MANRSRPGNSSFTPDQLHAFGVSNNKDMPVQAGPPPLFPPLLSKPVKLKITSYTSDKMFWDEQFIFEMKETPYYLSKTSDNIIGASEKPKANFVYSHMPAELRPNFTKKHKLPNDGGNAVKKSKDFDLETRLKMLEQKEMIKVKEEPKIKDEMESEEEEDAGSEQFDNEMDDENDYGNNYFDNGEAFNEEDDMDDGPVY
ncbi:DNA-directed RNA polymerase III subunit RPC7 [Culicoides brevitarsis]|uniref:DNA-directed RNA polymerase III subunit RPC7 n=1 Tax=Culicoides brevitarsis TaxID=469753 RepID=UPI00307B5E33